MLLLGGAFAGVSLVMSKAVSPKRPSAAKSAPYECGIVPRNEPPERFPVR
ncbi:MAG: NADH-quinone oxidoreductase subunit A, partial [Myxococcales bacterium]|nr:NADH-quinone oxidoreductase subunit A [Myxococcales bacterium]